MAEKRKIIAWAAQAVGYSAATNTSHYAVAGSSISAAAAKAAAKAKIQRAYPAAVIRRADSQPIRAGE